MAIGAEPDTLARLALFADLGRPQLEAIAHTYDEELFPQGQRVLRRGMSGGSLYVIVDGEARVLRGDQELARLGRGEFFGDVSALLEQPPTADVVATTALRCLVVPGVEVERFLLAYPPVAVRMLKAMVQRLANTLEWLG
jgi:CRP/FNR family transcriptional regulator, cyclic AMP receptor protein